MKYHVKETSTGVTRGTFDSLIDAGQWLRYLARYDMSVGRHADNERSCAKFYVERRWDGQPAMYVRGIEYAHLWVDDIAERQDVWVDKLGMPNG